MDKLLAIRRTVMRIFTATVVSLLVLNSSVLVGAVHSSDTSYSENGSFTMRVTTDKPSYLRGEVVRIRVYAINNENKAIMYPTMIGYDIFDSKGRGVIGCGVDITWASPIPTFPPRSETLLQLSSGDETFVWNQKDINRKTVSVGTYTIKVSLNSEVCVEVTINIHPNIDAFPRASRWGFTFY